MRPPLVIAGMHGFGDCIHQRAIIRQLLPRFDLWLESSSVWAYHDFIPQGLKVIGKRTHLHTQIKNALRESGRFSRVTPPANARRMQISYSPALVRQKRSVLAAMCAATGCDYERADFRLPVPNEWQAKAQPWLDRWKPQKPLLIYRPLVERPSDWTGCKARNPDFRAYAELFNLIARDFFVVSVADLVPGKEWMVGHAVHADAICHKGELEFETLAALFSRAALIYSSPGFAVVLAQAVGAPVACVFGGYERAYSFSAGARHSPYLGIEPKRPCDCFQHNHNCNKEIDLARASEQLKAFAETAARSAVAA